MKKIIMASKDAPIPNKINDFKKKLFLLRENKNANDLLREATIMHNLLAESLWQYKI